MDRIGPCPGLTGSLGPGEVTLRADELHGIRGSDRSAGGAAGEGTTRASEPWTADRAREAAARGNDRAAFRSTEPGAPPVTVTLSDIASFAPTVGGNHMEPNGWIVVGLDTNFYSDVSTQVVEGTLLGMPAAVKFTPLSWNWSYGDGATKHSANRGASWAALHLAEFAPTTTSHVFTTPGTFSIDLAIEYAAEYQFGGVDWYPIAGTLTLPANRIVATAGDATTVLVNRDCRENPTGAGC